jgi:hypothetical protein
LESGKRKSTHEALYVKYFEIKETPKRGLKLTINADFGDDHPGISAITTHLS